MAGGGSSSINAPSSRRAAHLSSSTAQQHGPLHHMPTPPLFLTVRFSTALPDLLLDIPHPERTTIVALKHQIRSRLTQPDSQRRLRFIHGGKILPDRAVVASVLKPLPPPPPPPPSPSADAAKHDPKGKGKAVESPLLQNTSSSAAVVEVAAGSSPARTQRVYVNCSIGDLLTDAELAQEARSAEEPVPEEVVSSASRNARGANSDEAWRRTTGGGGGGDFNGGGVSGGLSPSIAGGHGGGSTLPPGPRGFDRLLAAGFTPAEVSQLRLQFRSITEARHTADSMPSPDTLRNMEDAWMENNNDGLPSGTASTTGGGIDGMDTGWAGGSSGDPFLGGRNSTGGGGGGGGGEEYGLAGIVDLLVWGMFVGFVWPLGAIGWLVRGAEKIPKRMRVFVYCGFMLSLLVGIIRMIV